MTGRFSHDDQQVRPFLEQIDKLIEHFSGDGAYDKTPVYTPAIEHSPNVDLVIPPRANAVKNNNAAALRNRNIIEIAEKGRMINSGVLNKMTSLGMPQGYRST